MNCTKCGSQIPAGEKYCNVCGAEQPVPVNQTVEQDVSIQASQPISAPVASVAPEINNQTNAIHSGENVQGDNNIQPSISEVTPMSNAPIQQSQPVEAVVNNTQTPEVQQNVAMNNTPVVDSTSANQASVVEEKPKKKKSKIGLIIIILLILGIVGYFGWQFVSLMNEANRVKSQQNNNQKEVLGKVTNDGNKYTIDLNDIENDKTYKYTINDKYIIKMNFTNSTNSEEDKDLNLFINDTKINSGFNNSDNLEFYVYGDSILFIDHFNQTSILSTFFDIFYLNTKEVIKLDSVKDQGIEFTINDNDDEYAWEFTNNKVTFYGLSLEPGGNVSICDRTTWEIDNMTPTSSAIIKASLVMENNALSKTANVEEKITMEELYNKNCQSEPTPTPTEPTTPTTDTTNPVDTTNPISNPVE